MTQELYTIQPDRPPKVSIVMAAYNHQAYVGEAIQSVLAQTFQEFEIIIVDDCSTDDTVDIIRQFADPRIKAYPQSENRGQFAVTRIGLEKAQGEYIAILNSDDAFQATKLEKQVHYLDNHPETGAVFTYAELIDENGNPYTKKHPLSAIFEQANRTRHEWLNFFFFKDNCLCHPSVLIRKECHDRIGFYDERLANVADFEFWIRLCLQDEIYIIPEKLTRFRILAHEQNMSGLKPSTKKRSQWEFYIAKKNYLTIKDIQEFIKIFPEAKDEACFNNTMDIPVNIGYLLGKVALKTDRPHLQMLGLDILYQLMADSASREALKRLYDFGYPDLIRCSGEANPYNLNFAAVEKKAEHKNSQVWKKLNRYIRNLLTR